MLNVVVINGGRGAAALIPALLERQGINLTSVVNAYDDGKSTGQIRRFFSMLGPSDIRKVQELMLPEDDPDYEASLRLFTYRYPLAVDRQAELAALAAFASGQADSIVGAVFKSPRIAGALRLFTEKFLAGLEVNEHAVGSQLDLADCSIMNCLYAGAHLALGRDFETATRYFDRLFKLKGTVLPTSIENKTLVAMREDGQMLYCEADIVELRSSVRIERLYLLDSAPDPARFESLDADQKRSYLANNQSFVAASSGVRRALREADIIIYSAGTQHSSLYPTYMSDGIAREIADNHGAYKVFVTNIGADYETPSYSASDFITGAYRYLNLGDKRKYAYEELFNTVLVNRPNRDCQSLVACDESRFAQTPVEWVIDDFESNERNGKHDGAKLVREIMNGYERATTLGEYGHG